VYVRTPRELADPDEAAAAARTAIAAATKMFRMVTGIGGPRYRRSRGLAEVLAKPLQPAANQLPHGP
jgi:hypothetical protein